MTPARSALITGGTSGIGLEVATALAGAGHRILTTGRDPDRGAAAEQQLQQAGAAAATFLPTDHSSLAATRELADRVRDSTRTLDLLVLNAGAMPAQRTLTAEGLDLEVAVDVISPVVLVDGLQSLLTGRHGARVLLVTSAAADRAPADTRTDPWQGQAYGAGMRAYAHAKRWKLHLAAGLADELAPAGLAVHAVSPGPAWTPMTPSPYAAHPRCFCPAVVACPRRPAPLHPPRGRAMPDTRRPRPHPRPEQPPAHQQPQHPTHRRRPPHRVRRSPSCASPRRKLTRLTPGPSSARGGYRHQGSNTRPEVQRLPSGEMSG